MTYQTLNRRLAIVVATFAFLGVVLATTALCTNYWSLFSASNPDFNANTVNDTQPIILLWNGLFQKCKTTAPCIVQFFASTFIICLLGALFLLVGGIFSVLDFPKASNLRFITPLLIFLACVLMTIGLVNYGSLYVLNYHSSRAMIAAMVFAYTALPISAFLAGRDSTLKRSVLINNELHDAQKHSTTNGNGL